MAEPSTTTLGIAAATAGITIGSAALGLDTETAIGALAGAAVFVTSAKEINLITRVIYLLASVIIGYFVAPEIINHTFIEVRAVAGFVGGLLGVTAGQLLLKQMHNTDLSWIIGGKKK